MGQSLVLIGLICLFGVGGVQCTEDLLRSMEEFREKIEQSFESHSRIQYVEKDVQKQLEGWIDVSSRDFSQDSERVANKMQTFLNHRLEAIRRIVSTSESEADAFVYTTYRAVVDNEECERFAQEIVEESLVNYSKHSNTNPPLSGVHINVESYVCDGAVVRDFEWTSSPKILQVMQSNLELGFAKSRQYIGTYSGLTRIFPSFQWTVEPAAISFDLFDPRYRQWFIGAEASPKDVLFLIDFSGSVKGQTQHLTKMTILHVLATLGPNDYFNAVWYSSRQELVFDYCFSGFLPATTRNKRLFQNQLERIEERDQAHLAPALNYSLSLFRQRAINASEFLQDTMGMGSGGHQIIMIFTDGIEEWPIALVEQEMDSQGEDIVRIFGFSMGYGTGELPILDYVSCNTRASYSIVDSIADVKLQSRSYLTTLAEVLALSYRDKGTAQKRPVSWSLPYMDTQGKGPVVTLSMPILNTMLNSTNLFLGVAGVDILFTELVKMLPNDEQIRTFVLDNNGIVVYHPKLMTPRREVYSVRRTACYDTSMPPRRGGRVQFGGSDERVLKLMGLVDSIQTTDILELEDPTEAFKKFREAMIDRACGRVFHDGDHEYRCHALENTPLVIGFVGRRSGTVLSLKYTSKKPQVAMKDLVGFYVPKRQLCGDRFDGVNDLERLAAYVNDEEDDQCTDDRKIPYAFTNILSSWSRSWPDLDENATCSTARLPDAGFSHHHLSSFVHTFSKISAFYPQCFFDYVKPILTEISSRNKPSDEEHGESLKTSVIEDSFVATKEIRDSKYGKLLATVGVQWKMQFFSELWINQTHWEVGWEECFKKQRDCHIITSTGYVVASSTSRLGSLAQVDFQLFDTLVDRGFLKPISRVDHQKYCKPEAGNSYSMSTSDAPSSSGPARSFVKALISTFHSVFWFIMGFCIPPLQAQPIMVGSICKFSRIKHLEQCSMEYVHYSLKTLKKSAMTIRHENCSRVATIMPFEKINLNLVIMDGLCDENETFKEADPFVPKRVPDCQLTTPFYRKPRLDVDYSRYHPDEFRRDCPALAAGVVYSGVLLCLSLLGSLTYV